MLCKVKCTHCNCFRKNNRNDYIHGIINFLLLYFRYQSNNQLLFIFCSWKPASTHFLMNFVILTSVSLMDAPYHLSSTSNLKVCSLFFYFSVYVFIKAWTNLLIPCALDDNMAFVELKGATLELLSKLIPEHARKQCPFLGL